MITIKLTTFVMNKKLTYLPVVLGIIVLVVFSVAYLYNKQSSALPKPQIPTYPNAQLVSENEWVTTDDISEVALYYSESFIQDEWENIEEPQDFDASQQQISASRGGYVVTISLSELDGQIEIMANYKLLK